MTLALLILAYNEEQKIKEETLIKKFYSDQSMDQSNDENLDNKENDESKNS